MMDVLSIAPCRTIADYDAAAILLRVYAASLPIDLAYQNFGAEVAGLPGEYAPPAGELLIARNFQGESVGCVALRPLEQRGVCEIKRLYVAPPSRGSGLGRRLVLTMIELARERYREMRLDTLSTMTAARTMYDSLGFAEIDPYYFSPIEGTVYLSLKFRSSSG